MADKELRVKITGTAEKFQEALKQAEKGIDRLGSEVAGRLSGGLIGGGIEGFVTRMVDIMMQVATKMENIVDRARSLNVSKSGIVTVENFSRYTGSDPQAGDQAIQTMRQARADALAGDDDAVRIFERIGLALGDIKDLKPDELFFRVLETIQQAPMSAERMFSYNRLLGRGYAASVIPIATDPTSVDLGREMGSGVGGWLQSLLPSGALNGFPLIGKYLLDRKATAQPEFSDFGLRQREQAEFMAEQNRQRAEQVGRSMLTTEERINEVIAERLRISRLITEENDPIKRQKFVGDAIAVESELAALTQKREGELMVKGSPRATDPLRQIGADFSRYGPSLTADIGKQQVTEIQRLRASLESGLERVRAAIDKELN
jgi:hypothetical protein